MYSLIWSVQPKFLFVVCAFHGIERNRGQIFYIINRKTPPPLPPLPNPLVFCGIILVVRAASVLCFDEAPSQASSLALRPQHLSGIAVALSWRLSPCKVCYAYGFQTKEKACKLQWVFAIADGNMSWSILRVETLRNAFHSYKSTEPVRSRHIESL